MDHTEIVKKLIGNINPIGETNTDDERFENLKSMCVLASNLFKEIANVANANRNSKEYSVKRSGDYAHDYLTETILIKI